MNNATASGSLFVDKEGLNQLLTNFLDIRSKIDTSINNVIQKINRVVEADNWPDIQEGSFATAKILEGNREVLAIKEESIKGAITGILEKLDQSENKVVSKFNDLLASYPQDSSEKIDVLADSKDQRSNVDFKELNEKRTVPRTGGLPSDQEQRMKQFERKAKGQYRDYVDAVEAEGGKPIPYEDFRDLQVDCGELQRPYPGYVTKREKEAQEYFRQLEEHRKAQANTPKIVEIAHAIRDIFKETFGLKSNAISKKANSTGSVIKNMATTGGSSSQNRSSIFSAFKL